MASEYPAIDENLAAFIKRQHIFFVATAPLAGDGHVNLSPKGLDTFAILDSHTVAYLDLTGSGIETVSHLRENGRIVVMFCAFEGPPKIVRLQGRGTVIEPSGAEFQSLEALFPPLEGRRAVIRVAVDRIADSCGYGVPRFAYQGQRSQLTAWTAQKGPDGVAAYQMEKNAVSIDGLLGLTRRR